jgi:hypothetical protein
MMSKASIWLGDERFEGQFQDDKAPRTCAALRSLLPIRQQLVHARWSGEACWVPLGDLPLGLPAENATSQPRPGEIIFYPGGISEAEILVAYGEVRFACKAGPIAGNPFLVITADLDRLARIGRDILWRGAQLIAISEEAR